MLYNFSCTLNVFCEGIFESINESAFLSDGTVQIEESVAAVYNKTEAFGRMLTEVQENIATKNKLMMSKQNILESDINSLTTMDNKLKEEIEKMKEKQRLTESKLLLVETEVERFTEKTKGNYVL